MAYRRSITARFNLFSQHRLSPSFSHSHRHHNVSEHSETSPISRNPQVRNYIQLRFLGGGNNFNNYRSFAIPAGYGMASTRNYSSEAVNTEVLKEAVRVLGDKAPAFVIPPAIDSLPPVVAFQHLIDYVHCFTGFNWWASIAATTIFIRFLMLPLDIHRRKTEAKYSLAQPHWDAIEKELSLKKVSIDEYLAKREALIKEYGASPFQHLKGLLISVPVHCSIFLAVISMAAKDPSFKEGGALGFTDLTDPRDFVLALSTYVLCLYANHLQLVNVPESDEVLRKKRFAGKSWLVTSAILYLFPKATYFVFTTSILFTMVYEVAIMNPLVKKLLWIPIVPVELPSTNQK